MIPSQKNVLSDILSFKRHVHTYVVNYQLSIKLWKKVIHML